MTGIDPLSKHGNRVVKVNVLVVGLEALKKEPYELIYYVKVNLLGDVASSLRR